MDQLRKYLLLQRIYSRSTIMQMAINYVVLAFVLAPVIAYARHKAGLLLVLVLLASLITLLMFIRAIARYIIAGQLLTGELYVKDLFLSSKISKSSMSYELDDVNHTKVLAGQTGLWEMYAAVFDIKRQTKDGDYLAIEAYYTVFEGVLNRSVPHLIFDGKKAKGRQYNKLYLQSQRLILEGGFSKIFDVYSPQHYQIDTMSFIAPDVMEALVALEDYDIELIDDRVFCSGPLLTEREQSDLQQKSLLLIEQLNYNLRTYRDDRLTKQLGKTIVTPFARALLKSPRRYLPPLIISGIGIVITVALAVTVDRSFLFDQIALIAYVVFITALTNMINVVRKNRRLEAKYRQLYKR